MAVGLKYYNIYDREGRLLGSTTAYAEHIAAEWAALNYGDDCVVRNQADEEAESEGGDEQTT